MTSNVTPDPYVQLFNLGTNFALGFWSDHEQKKYNDKVTKLQNAYIEAQDRQNLQLYYFNRDKIIADRLEAVEAIEVKAANMEKVATAQDAANLTNHVYRQQIQLKEQQSLNEQYLKSNDIYNTQTTLNSVAEKQAIDNELRKYDEIKTEATFDIEEETLNQIEAEGQFRARGVSGRSADKARQMSGYDLGRMIAQVNEATSSAGRNTKAVLEEIKADKISADLSAYAAKMLKPGVLPEIPLPTVTPREMYVLPRGLQESDFGPLPIPGAAYQPPSSNKVWNTQMMVNTGKTLTQGIEILSLLE